MKKDSYPNSPVIEVAWEIRFQDDTKIDLEKIQNEFVSKLIHQYPRADPINEAGFEVSFGLSEASNYTQFPKKHVGFELKDENIKNFVKLSTKNLIVNTREHKNFRKFRDALSDVLNIFNDVFPTFSFLDISRIGLRYINVCELPENNKDLIDKYLILPIDSNKYPIKTIGNFRSEMLQQFDPIKFRSIYQSILVENLPRILIDFDAFTTNIEEKDSGKSWIEDVIELTKNMHKLIKESFQVSITEEFVNEVMERL
ncbi:MAG: TIGR04255 family protein [Candidatus Kariarchaeaceae archaeon]